MLSNHFSASERDWMRDILCLAFFILVFYVFWLGSYPLFIPDEGRYAEVAREMVVTGDYVTPRVNGVAFLDKPVLYYWLQAAAINLFGIKEWALRFFPALLGVLGCVVTYICGRHLFNRRIGLMSAIILATTPLYFGGSHYANLDLEVAVFISCALLFFISAMQRIDKLRIYFFFAAYISAALAFLTKGLIGIVFPCMIIGTWMILLGHLNVLKKIYLVSGLILMTIIVLPWYVLVQKANPGFLHYFFITQQVSRFLSAGAFNNPSPFWFYLPIVLIGFFPWSSFLPQALGMSLHNVWKARHAHQTELFLLLWLIIVFVFFSIPHTKTISYILPIFPAAALLISHFLSTCWENTKQKSITLGITHLIIIGTSLAAILLAMPYYHWIDFAPAFNSYATLLAIVFIGGSIFSLLSIQSKTLLPLFMICASFSALFLFILVMGTTHLNLNTAKPLIDELQFIIKPQDEVVTYFKYYQDVPLYLERRITIVANWHAPDIANKDNWLRELWYGMSFQKTDDWLINESTFWKRWEDNKRLFVFVNNNYFDQFKKQAKSYYFLGRYNDILLLSNKPTILHLDNSRL